MCVGWASSLSLTVAELSVEDYGLELSLFPALQNRLSSAKSKVSLSSWDLLAVMCSLFLGTPEDRDAVLAHLDASEMETWASLSQGLL